MVVGCPYILILGRTQLSGPRFPLLTILIFNGLASLLSPNPCQIDRKWDCVSHLRTSPPHFLGLCRVGLYSGLPYSFPYPADGSFTHAEFCLEDFSTPSINSTPSTPSFTPGTSREEAAGARPAFRAAICSAKSAYSCANASRYPSGCPEGMRLACFADAVAPAPARLIVTGGLPYGVNRR